LSTADDPFRRDDVAVVLSGAFVAFGTTAPEPSNQAISRMAETRDERGLYRFPRERTPSSAITPAAIGIEDSSSGASATLDMTGLGQGIKG